MADPIMNEGIAFKLQDNGEWKPERVPDGLPDSVSISGYLTIDGYRCIVFEDRDGEMWAQKSSDVQVSSNTDPDIFSAELRILAKYIDSSKPSVRFLRLKLSELMNKIL